jgi:type III restriction enzyme
VVTGTQRELDGINLFSPDCKIEYIITIEALKEGWDCSFAYVFCSVRDVRSSKDAEQLLGRVLRMPFARRRKVEALNRAYAHLASPRFSEVAKMLADKLVDMGFETMEVPAHIRHGVPDDLFGSGDSVAMPPEPPLTLDLPSKPEFKPEHEPLLGNVSIIETDNGFRLEVKGKLDDALHDAVLKPFKGSDKKELLGQIEQHNARVEATLSPSERGIPFAPLPHLCAGQQGELELLEPESFLFLNGDWSPLEFAVELPNFSLKQSDTTFEVDMEGQKITYHIAEEREVYNLDLVETEITENDLVRWLDRQLRSPYLNQSILNRFLTATLSHLLLDKGYTLTALLRSKFLLVRALRQRLALLQGKAAVKGFQQALFDGVAPLESSFRHSFEFKPGLYPARSPFYSGRYKFKKHYYPIIEDLKVEGEEFLCAQAIDASPKVKHWVRNLVDRQQASFRLPLANGWFYPDFVAELEDGRLFVIEYKGAAYLTNDDSREKNSVGKVWAEKSGGKCLFLMAVESDDKGLNVCQQLEAAIG